MFVYVARLSPGIYYFVGVSQRPSEDVATQAKTFDYLRDHPFLEIVAQEEARPPFQKHINSTVETWKRTYKNVHICAAPPSPYINITVDAPINLACKDREEEEEEIEWGHLEIDPELHFSAGECDDYECDYATESDDDP